MRLRVKFDVTKPLKCENKIRALGQEWTTCNFKYERLPTFCYICEKLGHLHHQCEVRFQVQGNEIIRIWDDHIKDPPCWQAGGGDWWLVELMVIQARPIVRVQQASHLSENM
ncbi:hypothetical protein LINPERPRIM_LOCUS37691 [Linum perenne]